MNKYLTFALTTVTLLSVIILFLSGCTHKAESTLSNDTPDKEISVELPVFDGARAFRDLEYQVSLGPRTLNSDGHRKTGDWIIENLIEAGWEVDVQETSYMGHPIKNIIGKYGNGRPWIIIGAHYDTRSVADQDPILENRSLPVPGANDGASGVALLLELARILPHYIRSDSGGNNLLWANQLWLVFFDAEDNGSLPGWDWAMGSQVFVSALGEHPDAVVVVDMIGDLELNICYEGNSNQELLDSIWSTAFALGYAEYYNSSKVCHIRDDHTAFLEAGIPAADIIDFDYPYWHTVEDTVDKISSKSLEVVGETILEWLQSEQ